jgi:SAM-dependent methyltransferase
MVGRFVSRARDRRAARALERQLVYQAAKARDLPEDTTEIEAELVAYTREIRARLERYGAFAAGSRILEVGSGAHGLVFFLGDPGAIGVDPLADEYARLFPQWQRRAKTLKAFGESLPFADASFEVVLSDNVVDHARAPARIVSELVRVLAPGGLLFFTVHVHHAVYGQASRLHGAWMALGMPLEIGPFADHTVHLTLHGARRLFAPHALDFLHEDPGIEAAKAEARATAPRHAGDRLKRWFFKNARYELIARKAPR